jgi:hypothetical protein
LTLLRKNFVLTPIKMPAQPKGNSCECKVSRATMVMRIEYTMGVCHQAVAW